MTYSLHAIREVSVDGNIVKIWGPSSEGEGYQISDKGGWLGGLFDSEESAIKGYKLAGADAKTFYEITDRVCRYDREDRLVTLEDL